MYRESPNQNPKAPDHVFQIPGLDLEAMRLRLQKFVDAGHRYHLFGRNRGLRISRGNSCSGLVYDLLIAGGILNRKPRRHLIRDYVVTTPNNLVRMLQSVG